MGVGAFTQGSNLSGGLDLPLLLVILFFLFFLGLVYHLRQEDKREGYPLVSDRTDRTGGRVEVVGFPPLPKPKVFLQPHGRPPVYAPRDEHLLPLAAERREKGYGMPIDPLGDPMLSGIGPGSWVPKVDEPDLTYDEKPVFRPMRIAKQFSVADGDPDPRGWVVLGLDKKPAGTVVDLWIDRAEHKLTFFEVALSAAIAAERVVPGPDRAHYHMDLHAAIVSEEQAEKLRQKIEGREASNAKSPDEVRELLRAHEAEDEEPNPDWVLLPVEVASVDARSKIVRTAAITAAQFANVPRRKMATVVTAREENRIRGYFGGGLLWATPQRPEPLI